MGHGLGVDSDSSDASEGRALQAKPQDGLVSDVATATNQDRRPFQPCINPAAGRQGLAPSRSQQAGPTTALRAKDTRSGCPPSPKLQLRTVRAQDRQREAVKGLPLILENTFLS